MLKITLRDILEYKVPIEYLTCVYVWYDSERICLYVGKSDDVIDRFQRHFGQRLQRELTPIGRKALEAMPESLQWEIELYNLADCKAYYPPEYQALAVVAPPSYDIIIDLAESSLIEKLKPEVNLAKRSYTTTSRYTHAKPDESSALFLAV